MVEEVEVQCPSCWEHITLLVDASGGSAEYTEDCQVCCRPMAVRVDVAHDGALAVTVNAEDA